jgi:hypothetical protein
MELDEAAATVVVPSDVDLALLSAADDIFARSDAALTVLVKSTECQQPPQKPKPAPQPQKKKASLDDLLAEMDTHQSAKK